MGHVVFSLILLFSLFAGTQLANSSGENSDKTKAELTEIRKKIEELRQQEQTLLKKLAKETTEKQQHEVKVEIVGLLGQEVVRIPDSHKSKPTTVWTVRASGISCILNVGGKDFLELARQRKGKTIVLTGSLVAYRYRDAPHDYFVLSVASFKAGED